MESCTDVLPFFRVATWLAWMSAWAIRFSRTRNPSPSSQRDWSRRRRTVSCAAGRRLIPPKWRHTCVWHTLIYTLPPRLIKFYCIIALSKRFSFTGTIAGIICVLVLALYHPVMLSHFLHSLGNYTRRAISLEMCEINQSSVDLRCEPL